MIDNIYTIEEEVQELISEYSCSINKEELENVLRKAKHYLKNCEYKNIEGIDNSDLLEIRRNKTRLYDLIYRIEKWFDELLK